MRLKIIINMNSQAFGDQPGYELNDIMNELIQRIELNGMRPGPIKDSNKKIIGQVTIEQ